MNTLTTIDNLQYTLRSNTDHFYNSICFYTTHLIIVAGRWQSDSAVSMPSNTGTTIMTLNISKFQFVATVDGVCTSYLNTTSPSLAVTLLGTANGNLKGQIQVMPRTAVSVSFVDFIIIASAY